jgi:hypothetical protein
VGHGLLDVGRRLAVDSTLCGRMYHLGICWSDAIVDLFENEDLAQITSDTVLGLMTSPRRQSLH